LHSYKCQKKKTRLSGKQDKMEVSVVQTNQPVQRANPLMVVSRMISDGVKWVNWFFTMTKLDRFNAGIDTSGEGRGETSRNG